MTQLKSLTDDELHQSTLEAARRDRTATLVTIEHLEEVARRLLFSKRGFSSLQDYAENALGFSGPAAAERIAAMRLTVDVPETREKLHSGALNLSNAVAVQRFIRREEKASDRRISPQEKIRMIEEVSGSTVEQAKKTLLSFAVSPEPHLFRERIRPVTPTRTELCFYVNEDLMDELERAKELKGNLSLEEVFTAALAAYLEKVDPVRRKSRQLKRHTNMTERKVNAQPPVTAGNAVTDGTSVVSRKSENHPPMKKLPASPPYMGDYGYQSIRMSELRGRLDTRYYRVADQRALHARSGGRCEFVDEKTGRRCRSRFLIRPDHCLPWALGGPTELTNLRHYCPAHNTLAAVEVFGMRKMKPYLRI